MKSPTLIDTSYWIEYFRHYKNEASEKVEFFIREDRAATGVVLTELLQGARTNAEMEEVKTSLEAVHWIETDERLYARGVPTTSLSARLSVFS